MPTPKPSTRIFLILTLITLSIASQAQTETVIYNFANESGNSAPAGPAAGLVFDSSGNLYGTTSYGGARDYGVVFELSPIAGGGWQETTIHTFTGGTGGGAPQDGLIIDPAGNLYGTTSAGGDLNFGNVFKLSPSASGWHETVLYSFTGGADGGYPSAGLVLDSAGNLYGTTVYFGNVSSTCPDGCGTAFELSPRSGGWHFTLLHSFHLTDGIGSFASMTLDSAGNLYGISEGGTSENCEGRCGVVFELSPVTGRGWHETVLHNFTGPDGERPYGGLVLDASGNLYGATSEGGNLSDCSPTYGSGCGVIFKLSPEVGGGWHESIIHAFTGGADGAYPDNYTGATLTLDSLGNIYGSAAGGGSAGDGLIFEFSHASGAWEETILHNFTGPPDGDEPGCTPLFDSSGNLYGTTFVYAGTVFEITP
jgi:uncharacterized repeat protein (TIGR03803 family)